MNNGTQYEFSVNNFGLITYSLVDIYKSNIQEVDLILKYTGPTIFESFYLKNNTSNQIKFIENSFHERSKSIIKLPIKLIFPNNIKQGDYLVRGMLYILISGKKEFEKEIMLDIHIEKSEVNKKNNNLKHTFTTFNVYKNVNAIEIYYKKTIEKMKDELKIQMEKEKILEQIITILTQKKDALINENTILKTQIENNQYNQNLQVTQNIKIEKEKIQQEEVSTETDFNDYSNQIINEKVNKNENHPNILNQDESKPDLIKKTNQTHDNKDNFNMINDEQLVINKKEEIKEHKQNLELLTNLQCFEFSLENFEKIKDNYKKLKQEYLTIIGENIKIKKQLNEIKKEQINKIMNELNNKFYVNSIFDKKDIEEAIIKGNGNLKEIQNILFV